MGGYRTPAQLWSLGLLWPASDTLHHPGHSADFCHCSEADVRREVMNGEVWWEADIRS